MKEVDENDPDKLKEAGNEAFKAQEFDVAIDYYSKAIEVGNLKNLNTKVWVYYSNRANAYL